MTHCRERSKTPRTLGDDPRMIAKHYAKGSTGYQARTIEVLNRVHDTPLAHGENDATSPVFSKLKLVPGVGLEPTLPLPEKGF